MGHLGHSASLAKACNENTLEIDCDTFIFYSPVERVHYQNPPKAAEVKGLLNTYGGVRGLQIFTHEHPDTITCLY